MTATVSQRATPAWKVQTGTGEGLTDFPVPLLPEPRIWLSDDADYPRAKAAMDAYQAQRGAIARAQRQEELAAGTAETFGALLRRRPVFVLVTLIGMLVVASLVLLPFVLLRG